MGLIHRFLEKKIFSIDFSKYNLGNILKHAVENTCYYKNFDYRDINSFPILTKDIIRENFEHLISEDIKSRKWWINTSGGSTGEPVKIIQDKEYLEANRYITYYQKKKIGYNFGDKIIKLWGDEREILKYSKSFKEKFLNKIKNTIFLNTFSMSNEIMEKYIDIIIKNKPKLIVAYVHSIYELAKFINENHININSVGAIITSAGTLYDFMRKEIEKAFKTKVYNRYGSREVGNIACEEPNKEGLIVSKGVYLEVLTPEGEIKNNGFGEILVTSLINYVMPLVRYRIGDMGILETWDNGKQVIKSIKGRDVSFFKTIEGKLIDGEYFTHLMYNKFWIKKFQFIQKNYNLVEVKIVPYYEKNSKDIKDIEMGVKKIMGNDCIVRFYFEDDLKPLKSGKFLYTISEV